MTTKLMHVFVSNGGGKPHRIVDVALDPELTTVKRLLQHILETKDESVMDISMAIVSDVAIFDATKVAVSNVLLPTVETVFAESIETVSDVLLPAVETVSDATKMEVSDSNGAKAKVSDEADQAKAKICDEPKSKVFDEVATKTTKAMLWLDDHFIHKDNEDTNISAFYATRIWTCIILQPTMTVTIANLTGKVYKLMVGPNYVVKMIKYGIYLSEGIPPEQQRLVFSGKTLDDDLKTLEYYKIQNESKVHCILRLRGGGGGASDSSGIAFSLMNNENKTVHQWSRHAPIWRSAYPGLCIEALCLNTDCKAFNRMVVLNFGFTDLEINEFSQSYCRSCYKIVHVSKESSDGTCAFNNCRWRMVGIKDDVVKFTNWAVVNDEYHRFEGSKASKQQGTWQKLTLCTKPAVVWDSENSKWVNYMHECVVCRNLVSSTELQMTQLACGHQFHAQCISVWGTTRGSPCPFCI